MLARLYADAKGGRRGQKLALPPAAAAAATDVSDPLEKKEGDGSSAASTMSGGGESGLETDVQEVILPPGRRSLLRLGVRAVEEGQLTINGVTWTMNEVAHGTHTLELRGRRLNSNKQQRMNKVYAFDQSLSMTAVAAMPLLQAKLDGLPQTMMFGEYVQAALILTNVGRTPVSEAKLRISQPAFCIPVDSSAAASGGGGGELVMPPAAAKTTGATVVSGTRMKLSAESPPPPIPQKGGKKDKDKDKENDYTLLTLSLPDSGGQLLPGGVLKLPMWIRAAALGAHALHFVCAYVPANATPLLKRRLCPLSASCVSTLRLGYSTRSCRYLTATASTAQQMPPHHHHNRHLRTASLYKSRTSRRQRDYKLHRSPV